MSREAEFFAPASRSADGQRRRGQAYYGLDRQPRRTYPCSAIQNPQREDDCPSAFGCSYVRPTPAGRRADGSLRSARRAHCRSPRRDYDELIPEPQLQQRLAELEREGITQPYFLRRLIRSAGGEAYGLEDAAAAAPAAGVSVPRTTAQPPLGGTRRANFSFPPNALFPMREAAAPRDARATALGRLAALQAASRPVSGAPPPPPPPGVPRSAWVDRPGALARQYAAESPADAALSAVAESPYEYEEDGEGDGEDGGVDYDVEDMDDDDGPPLPELRGRFGDRSSAPRE